MAKRKQPHPITKEDFDKLLEEVKKERDKHYKPRAKRYTPRGERINQYIISLCLGFGAGMRISEIFGLEKNQKYVYKNKEGKVTDKVLKSKISPIVPDRIENNYIRVVGGKGQKDRTVPLPTKVLRQAGITRQELLKNLPLKVKYRSAQQFITKLGKKVLDKHITFHMLRHGFVSHLFRKGFSAPQIQAWAGHSRLDTTGLYAHTQVDDETLKKLEDSF